MIHQGMYNHRNDRITNVTSSTRNKNTNRGHITKSVISKKDLIECHMVNGEKGIDNQG